MFAVPGWNVSAQVKTQVEAPKPKDQTKPGKKAQKRKERREEKEVNVDNLAEKWESITSGKSGEVKQSKTAEADGAVEADDATQEKRGKKRKRGKAGGNKDKQQDENGTKESEQAEEEEVKPSPVKASEEKSTATDGESKRDKKKRKKESKADKLLAANAAEAKAVPVAPTLENLLPEPKGLTPLQRSMRSKLASARFRHLNEALYTKPSADSASLFKEDPSMFEDYHRGFAQQVEVWPSNPVDSYVNSILVRSKLRNKDQRKDRKAQNKAAVRRGPGFEDEQEAISIAPPRGDAKPLPRDFKGHSTIADLGCGTASLSYRLQPHLNSLNLTFHSFDLSKPSGPSADLVTVADIAALPLADNSVDVAIFCLALMGTNWLDFIDEAYRILRWRGELWVSEIKSRFGRVDKKKGGVPINSIGSLRKPVDSKKLAAASKNNKKKAQKGEKPPEEGPEDSEDEAELAVVVDGQDAKEGTDVSAFVNVLRKRGFVLDALPERPGDAIDLSNKMFVKMQFVKAAHPSRGKNAREDQKEGAVAQRGGGLKFGLKGKRMGLGADDEGEGEADNAVLKPCLYKIR